RDAPHEYEGLLAGLQRAGEAVHDGIHLGVRELAAEMPAVVAGDAVDRGDIHALALQLVRRLVGLVERRSLIAVRASQPHGLEEALERREHTDLEAVVEARGLERLADLLLD